MTAILDETIGGAGCVVNIMGPAGIGKSRLVRESAAIAAGRDVSVFTTYCESHARDIPFRVVARLLCKGMGINDLDDVGAARTGTRVEHLLRSYQPDRRDRCACGGVPGRDAAFATELAYGTLRIRGLLDAIIANAADRPVERIDPLLLDLLRLPTSAHTR